MPTAYKGVQVPVPTDYADGPKLARDMVDTLPASDALVALNGGTTAGPLRLFATNALRDGWTAPPLGALASVTGTGILYVWNIPAGQTAPRWVQLVSTTEAAPYVPQGVMFAYDGQGLQQSSTISPQEDNLFLNSTVPGQVRAGRTALVTLTCRAFMSGGASALNFKLGVTNAGHAQVANVGVLSIPADSAQSTNQMPTFACSAMFALGYTGALTVQAYAKNTGTFNAAVRDSVLRVAEI